MILKLILFIIAIVVFIFYMGFNLENKCAIWLFVKTFDNVPVFMNSLISFAFGVLCTLPLAFARRIKKNRQIQKKQKQEQKNQLNVQNQITQSAQPKPKTSSKSKKAEPKKAETSGEENALT
ncbi:MAG: hypothetical protein ACI4LX_03975 [Treponema sp.]